MNLKFMSLINEPYMAKPKPTFLDLNYFEINYYPFMINLEIFDESFDSFDVLSIKVCLSSKTKNGNTKVFNTIKK